MTSPGRGTVNAGPFAIVVTAAPALQAATAVGAESLLPVATTGNVGSTARYTMKIGSPTLTGTGTVSRSGKRRSSSTARPSPRRTSSRGSDLAPAWDPRPVRIGRPAHPRAPR
jgi:hypothetical protein